MQHRSVTRAAGDPRRGNNHVGRGSATHLTQPAHHNQGNHRLRPCPVPQARAVAELGLAVSLGLGAKAGPAVAPRLALFWAGRGCSAWFAGAILHGTWHSWGFGARALPPGASPWGASSAACKIKAVTGGPSLGCDELGSPCPGGLQLGSDPGGESLSWMRGCAQGGKGSYCRGAETAGQWQATALGSSHCRAGFK